MTSRGRVLIVDDDPGLLRLLAIRLEREQFTVETAGDGRQALAILPSFRPQLIVTDLRMEGIDGMTLFEMVKARQPLLPLIVLTAHGTIPDAVEATKRGVYAYLTKPFDGDALIAHIERAIRLLAEPEFGGESDANAAWRNEIVTRSPRMETLLHEVARVAASNTSVLVLGESGTGKELLARAIHKMSPRRAAPFIAVNCTAIPETLLESELFGHAKGSFTGASATHEGLFRAADGGTLFLDEIGDMPNALQAKLLRALQDGEIRPVGATKGVPVDVRLVSATHQNLERKVEQQEFREDLYYRLNVVSLDIPPLSDRREDIPLLAEHFLALTRKRDAVNVTDFSADAKEELIAAPWPGNVRQLRNVVEQCAVLSVTPIIPQSLVQKALRRKPRELLSFATARDRFERDYLVGLMQMTEGNVAQAARLAQRNRSEFYKLLRRHKLVPEHFRDQSE